jgi:hypothetical protein
MEKIEIVKSETANEYTKNVFINCPFDEEYLTLLRPLLFTVTYLGYDTRIASERFDSGEQRIHKISELIHQSRFSIHDISRMRSRKKNEVSRLNMAFELGLDIGCRLFNTNLPSKKLCLVLEREQYDYQKGISDLAGVDIKSHNDIPEILIRQVRNWFAENTSRRISSPSVIWMIFNEFMTDFDEKRKGEGFSEADLLLMPIPEYINFIKSWLITTPRSTKK